MRQGEGLYYNSDHMTRSHDPFHVLTTPIFQVPKTDDGLEAIVFTAQGDMRQALNNLQSTFDGFAFVNASNVFKV